MEESSRREATRSNWIAQGRQPTIDETCAVAKEIVGLRTAKPLQPSFYIAVDVSKDGSSSQLSHFGAKNKISIAIAVPSSRTAPIMPIRK